MMQNWFEHADPPQLEHVEGGESGEGGGEGGGDEGGGDDGGGGGGGGGGGAGDLRSTSGTCSTCCSHT